MRARLLFVMVAAGCAVSAATACSSPDATLEATASARKTTQASSVSIAMFDKGGNALGSCSGTLVAKDLVLTAGHCAAGAARWTVAHGSDATSEATRAVTPWKAFGSDLSHPDHSDVALLVLDQPIALDAYPAIATSRLADGASALRFARKAASADVTASTEIAVTSMAKKGFRLNYGAEIADPGGFVDTGGAIIDPKTGKIHGVVSGVGKESGLLHIARVDNFAKWITKATTCVSTSSGLGTRTYPDNGGSSGSSGYGGGSSGWPGGGGGDWGGYGGDGEKLDGGGPPSTDGSAGIPGSSSGSSGGSSGTSSGGSSGTSSGGIDTSGSDSKCPGVPSCDGSDCPGGAGSPSGSSGSSGSTGGSSGSSGSTGAPSGGDEVCPGPPSCPEPDSQACSGAACGGCGGVSGCVDATIDYGNCASCGAPAGTGSSPVVR